MIEDRELKPQKFLCLFAFSPIETSNVIHKKKLFPQRLRIRKLKVDSQKISQNDTNIEGSNHKHVEV